MRVWIAVGIGLVLGATPGCYQRHERCDTGTLCGACVLGDCDADANEGCAEGEVCRGVWFVTVEPGEVGALCTDPGRRRRLGEGCSGFDCEPELMCAGDPRTCLPTCCLGSPCPPGMDCWPVAFELEPSWRFFPVMGICSPRGDGCDVIRQTRCGPGEACYPNGATASCAAPGTLAAGAPCLRLVDCRPGLTCFTEEDGEATCRPLCELDVDCGPSEACEPFGGRLRVGVCR